MAQRVKDIANKLDDLSLIHRTYTAEGENHLTQIIFELPTCNMAPMHACAHTQTKTNMINVI